MRVAPLRAIVLVLLSCASKATRPHSGWRTEWIAPRGLGLSHLLSTRPGWSTADVAAHSGDAVICVPEIVTLAECDRLVRAAQQAEIVAEEHNFVRVHVHKHLPSAEVALCNSIFVRMFRFVDSTLPSLRACNFALDEPTHATLHELYEQGELEFSTHEPAINIYQEGGGFTPHEDGCALTVLIPLSSPSDGTFTGGGTGFWPPIEQRAEQSREAPSLVLKPARGTAMLFTGDVTHAGLPVTSGTRVVLVASFSRKGRTQSEVEHVGGKRYVRMRCPGGQVQIYVGDAGVERLLRVEYADGIIEHFESLGEVERLVRSVLPNGDVEHFEGEEGEERLVRKVFANGEVQNLR